MTDRSTGGRATSAPASPSEDAHTVHDPVLLAMANWRRQGLARTPHFIAAYSVIRVEEIIRTANSAALKPLQLTHQRHEALSLLYYSRKGEMRLSRLSERLVLHPTSITTTVDTLERLGYAERVPHATDRRTTLARITPKGRDAIERTDVAMAEVKSGLGAMSPEQAMAVFEVLVKVRAAAGDFAAEGKDEHRTFDDPVLEAEMHWRTYGWDAHPYGIASLSLLRVEEILRRSDEVALGPHQLTHARHEALSLLYFARNGELALSRMSSLLTLHPTSITSTIDTLERLGYAQRVPHPTDRRTTLARITKAGRAAIDQSSQVISNDLYGLSALTDHDAQHLFDLLEPVRRSVGDITPETAAG
jgi:DNA-binding MarR family transcriptional regulator